MYILRICEQPSETSEPAITWSFLKWHGKYQWSRSKIFSPTSRPSPCTPPRGRMCVTRSAIRILRAQSLYCTSAAEGPMTSPQVPGLWPVSLSFCMSASEKVFLSVTRARWHGDGSFLLAAYLARILRSASVHTTPLPSSSSCFEKKPATPLRISISSLPSQ